MSEDPYSLLDVSWRSALILSLVSVILVTAFTLLFRSIEATASRFLAFFLLVFCINQIPQIIGFSGFYQAFPNLTFAPFNNELWLGPLLLAHTLSLLKHGKPTYYWYLFIPGLCQTIYYCVAFLGFDTYQEKWAYTDAFHLVYIAPVESVFTVGLSLFCTLMAYRHTKIYQRQLLDLNSDLEPYDISWLKWMIAITGLLVIVWSSFEIVLRFVEDLSYVSQFPFQLLFSAMVVLLSQRALSSIRLPFPTPIKIESEAHTDEVKQANLAERIMDELHGSKSYLHQQFSLNDLARVLGTNETYVSRAINQHLGKNFNTLINQIRIEHAKNLIQQSQPIKLADVMYDSGFSSKASFNRSFKQFSGMTPTQYQSNSQT